MAHRQRGTAQEPDEKTCVSCGRRMEWRAKWAANWDEVRFCSAACRRRGITPTDQELEATILRLLAAAPTICPSDAARTVGGADWSHLEEPARRAARRLVAAGQVQITQAGSEVNPSTAKGQFRVRRAR